MIRFFISPPFPPFSRQVFCSCIYLSHNQNLARTASLCRPFYPYKTFSPRRKGSRRRSCRGSPVCTSCRRTHTRQRNARSCSLPRLQTADSTVCHSSEARDTALRENRRSHRKTYRTRKIQRTFRQAEGKCRQAPPRRQLCT